MSWNINRVILIGRLTKDPELKTTPSGTAVVNFSIAVGGKPDKNGGDSVSFFNCQAWNKAAENISNYLHKGSLICIDGRLNQRSWTGQDGTKHSTVEIIAERVEFLGQPKGQQPSQPEPETENDPDF